MGVSKMIGVEAVLVGVITLNGRIILFLRLVERTDVTDYGYVRDISI
jgi:hypothetical protein